MNKTIKKITALGMATVAAAFLTMAKPNMAFAEEKQQQKQVTLDSRVSKQAAEQSKEAPKLVVPTYNVMETAATDKGDIRTRLFTGFNVNLGPVYIGHHGLNQMNNLEGKTYYGRNTFYLGAQGFDHATLAVVMESNKNGIVDTKFGIRNLSLMKLVADYGWMDVVANKDSLVVQSFCGKSLGKGFGAEWVQKETFGKGAPAKHYTELQVFKKVADYLKVFVRAEVPNFETSKATYLAGTIWSLVK